MGEYGRRREFDASRSESCNDDEVAEFEVECATACTEAGDEIGLLRQVLGFVGANANDEPVNTANTTQNITWDVIAVFDLLSWIYSTARGIHLVPVPL